MLIAAKVAALLVLAAVCSFAPGFFVVRRFRWSPLEKLCGSVALSLIVVYCAAFAVFASGAPRWTYWAISAACVASGVASMRDAARLAAAPRVRRTLAGFAFLLAWCLAFLLTVRHYAGAGWSFDWVEHFHRTIFFLDRLPLETQFGEYHLAARPPLMNVIAAFLLAHAGARFELFSVVFTFLNVLVLLPCVLLAQRFGGARVWLVVALLACNPLFVENATYSWTKLLTVFYVLFAVWLYLRGGALRTGAAFVCLAAAMLTHYSAGPYLVVIALHYGLRVPFGGWRRWKEAALAAAVSLALLFTWLGWSLATYGRNATFRSNTTVTHSGTSAVSTPRKVAGNVVATVVPHPLRKDVPLQIFEQESGSGYARDYLFLIYQTNLVVAAGIVAGPLLVLLAIRALAHRHRDRRFWLLFLPTTAVLGIAVHGAPDAYGVTHVTLQPLVILGLTFLAARFRRLPRALRVAVVLGCLVDFTAGIAHHFWLQSEDRDTNPRAFRIEIVRGRDEPQSHFSRFALGNWWAKQERALIAETLRRVAAGSPLHDDLSWQLVILRDDDLRWWRGWFARHGGRMTFLGDHVRREPVFACIAAMFAAVMVMLARGALTRPERPSA